MPVSPAALAALVQTSVNSRMSAVSGYAPLAQKNPAYFIQMCTAIGSGIILGSPVIGFTTSDIGFSGTPPIPGVGSGVGIVTDPTFLIEDLYTRIREYVISQFGKTSHDPYPPGPTNSGQYLKALCEGINDAILAYYPTAWTLVSAHPLVYAGSGSIAAGNFTGVVPTAIQSQIISLSPTLQGSFWPKLAQAIGESYSALIEQHSTGTVTIVGVCVPSLAQVCNLPGAGAGTGTAT